MAMYLSFIFDAFLRLKLPLHIYIYIYIYSFDLNSFVLIVVKPDVLYYHCSRLYMNTFSFPQFLHILTKGWMGAGLVRMIIIQLKDDVDTGSSNLE